MRLELKQDAIEVKPEDEQDVAYIRDTLGLTTLGQSVQLKLTNDKTHFGAESPNSYYLKAGPQSEQEGDSD